MGKPAFVSSGGTGAVGMQLNPQQAKLYLSTQMFGEQDMTAITKQGLEFQKYMERATQEANSNAKKVQDSMGKFMDALHGGQAKDALAAKREKESYKELLERGPFRAMADTGAEMIKVGKEMQ